MPDLPPPDPNEYVLGPGNRESDVIPPHGAFFLAGPPSPEADRLSTAILRARPGTLLVVASG
jgi:hypothetical protein